MNRKDAENICRSAKGRLATINNAEKTRALLEEVLLPYKMDVHIGLGGPPLQPPAAGGSNTFRNWEWDSKVPFTYSNWGAAENRQKGELVKQPDGWGPNGAKVMANEISCVSAVAIKESRTFGWVWQQVGTWDDQPCSQGNAVICELP